MPQEGAESYFEEDVNLNGVQVPHLAPSTVSGHWDMVLTWGARISSKKNKHK